MAMKIDLTAFKDLFIDPISHERMTDPVIASVCGHTFERKQITGWVAECTAKGGEGTCPLDHLLLAISQVASNRFILNALTALKKLEEKKGSLTFKAVVGKQDEGNDMSLFEIDTDEVLDGEETEYLSQAADSIKKRRDSDKKINIPDRLKSPIKFGSKEENSCYSKTYSKKLSC